MTSDNKIIIRIGIGITEFHFYVLLQVYFLAAPTLGMSSWLSGWGEVIHILELQQGFYRLP